MGHRAHLYQNMFTGTWMIDVLWDIEPADDPEPPAVLDTDIPLPVRVDSESAAVLDTGIRVSRLLEPPVQEAAVDAALRAASWLAVGEWQGGGGELSVHVSRIDHARLTAWGLWLEGGGQPTRPVIDGIPLDDVHAAGARMIDEMVTNLRRVYGDALIGSLVDGVRRNRLISGAIAEGLSPVLDGLLRGESVESWQQARHAAHGGSDILWDLLVLRPLAVVLSGAVDKACAEEGVAARAFAGSDQPLVDRR